MKYPISDEIILTLHPNYTPYQVNRYRKRRRRELRKRDFKRHVNRHSLLYSILSIIIGLVIFPYLIILIAIPLIGAVATTSSK